MVSYSDIHIPNSKLIHITEITQTSKMRKKEEFLRAFEPILAEATQTAYKGSPADTQNKIRRVVEVWRQRQIFSPPTQQEVEKRINGMHGHVWDPGVVLT
jgi:regulator of Ty1 transposition protein 103